MKQMVSQSNDSHYKPFSILVTGATGFIGSRLISSLVSSGYSVKGLSRKQLSGNDKVKYVKADVFNFDELKNTMKLSNCVISLPMHPYLSKKDVNYISNTVDEIIRNLIWIIACLVLF